MVTATLAEAARLAGAGRYEQAEALVRELGGRDSGDPAVLDLLARIHAQRGELTDADDCWARAQALDGASSAARAGRRRIAALRAHRYRSPALRIALVVAAVAVLGTGGAALAQREPAPDPRLVARLDGLADTQRRLTGRLDTLAAELDRIGARRERVLRDVSQAVADVDALQAYRRGDSLVVTFPGGVFTVGTELGADGADALDRLARVLRRFGTDVSVTVTGHTEGVPVSPTLGYPDNIALGFARARSAAERMSVSAGLPMPMFLLSGAGAADTPFPDSAAPELNRTVTVTLRPV